MAEQLQVLPVEEQRGESIPLSRNIEAGRVGSCLDFVEFLAVLLVKGRCPESLGSSGVKRCKIWSFHAPLPRGRCSWSPGNEVVILHSRENGWTSAGVFLE